MSTRQWLLHADVEDWMDGAFVWMETCEGNGFWYTLSVKWSQKLKEYEII